MKTFNYNWIYGVLFGVLVPVDARSKAGSPAARLLGLWVQIPPGTWIISLFRVLCLVRYRSLRPADHLSRGVLPSVVCLSVIVGPR